MKNEYRGNRSYRRYSNRRRKKTPIVLGVVGGLIFIALVVYIIIWVVGRNGESPFEMNQQEHDPNQEISSISSTPTAVPTVGGVITEPPTPTEVASVTEAPSATPTPEVVEPSATPPEQQESYVIMLDPGHGGRFAGAYYNQRAEKTLTLAIAQYAKAYLEEHYDVFTVYMTREDDTILDNDRDKDIELRVAKAVECEADIFVSFHLNATDAHKKNGAEIMCPHRASVKQEAFRLADCILTELVALGLKNNGPEIVRSQSAFDADGNALEGLLVNRYTADNNMVGVIIEHCYMDSEVDAVYIQDEAALQALGEADARGIAAYFGY